MKEAFWGVLVVMLGLFGIVVVNVFQNVTVDNDRVYYVLKESTEASMYDALDLSYYRTHGTFRIVEEKFVESLTKRFASSVTSGKYKIVIANVNELPPLASVYTTSGVTALTGDSFSLTNAVNGIIEAKYSIDEVLNFLDITEEEWNQIMNENTTTDYCSNSVLDKEMECINGDVRFDGWDDVVIASSVCDDEVLTAKSTSANYSICKCGKWESQSSGSIKANPVLSGSEYTYTWNFNYSTAINSINEVMTAKVKKSICTKNISIMVPSNWETNQAAANGNYTGTSTEYYEPTTDNSSYSLCPSGGIRIPVYKDQDGTKFTSYMLHISYDPSNSANRRLTWTSGNETYLTVNTRNPKINCILNSTNSNCLSKAIITTTANAWNAVKDGAEVTIPVTATSSNGKTSTCNVVLYNGYVTPSCTTISLKTGASSKMSSSFTPSNANFTKFTWSSSNTNVATIDSTTGAVVAKEVGDTTITVTATGGKTGTCKVTTEGYTTTEVYSGNFYPSGRFQIYDYYKDTGGDLVKVAVWAYFKNGQVVQENTVTEVGRANSTEDPTLYNNYLTNATKIHDSVTNIPKSSAAFASSITTKKNAISSTSSTYSGGSGVVNSCFTAGTQVTTIDGYKNIEEISIGDSVLSYNYKTGINEYKTVLDTFIHENVEEEMYEIEINNEVIKVTGNHKFYTLRDSNLCTDKDYLSELGYEWIEAKDLKLGDKIKGSDGALYEISNIKHYSEIITVYNIKVEDNNNYYVGYGYLAHNKGNNTGTGTGSGTGNAVASCFTAGTQVTTIDGYKNIEEISIGDSVLSYNYKTGINEYKKVLNTFIHENVEEEMYEIEINNEIIKVTGNHKFYTLRYSNLCIDKDYLSELGYEWIEAKDLKVGDKIKGSDGVLYEISNIKHYSEIITVYNIKVEDNNNYYVGYGYLAHNKTTGGSGGGGNSNSCFTAGTQVTTIDGYKNIEEISIGDSVLSYNYKTGINEYKTVLNTFIHENVEEEMYEIEINNEVIKVTGNHKFYTLRDSNLCIDKDYLSELGYEWIEAKDLKVGDKIKGSDGILYEISNIKHYSEIITVYNINVEDNNNYYVGYGYLVHNKGVVATVTNAVSRAVSSVVSRVFPSYSRRWCLIEDTMVTLADGSLKKIQDITYDDLLLVWDYKNGEFVYEYPIFIKAVDTNTDYQIITFSDGTTLGTIGDHAIYNADLNMYVSVKDESKFNVGTNVLKEVNGKLSKISVVSIEKKSEAVKNYYVATTRYLNIFANGILTSDSNLTIDNQYSFDENATWINYDNSSFDRNEFSNYSDNIYYGYRINELKSLVDENKLSIDDIYDYIKLIEENKISNEYWKVTTSNDTKYMSSGITLKEGSFYTLPAPVKESNKTFVGWYNMADGKMYNTGDTLTINCGTYFKAIWE